MRYRWTLAILTGLAAAWAPAQMAPFAIPFETRPEALQLPFSPLHESSRLVAREGHFFDQSGRRVRIWGVNLAFNANFPTHPDAETLARRLAAAGVNSVRCHHMDSAVWPRGLWNADRKTIHPEALDRLCYLIDQLARHGVYTNINLHVGARHSRVLALPDSKRDYDKVVNLFTPPLIEAQKKYAAQLLNHVNPYRQMRLADDPAVAFVEITNENSFFMWDGDEALRTLEPYYLAILQARYNDWLLARYGDTLKLRDAWCGHGEALGANLLTNGDFAQAANAAAPGCWELETHGDCTATLSLAENSLRIIPGQIDQTGWHLQLRQTGLKLRQDQVYTISFQAWAEKPRSISLSVIQSNEPWANVGLAQPIVLSTEPEQFNIAFTARQTESDARLCFIFGNESGPFRIAGVQLQSGAQYDLEPARLEDRTILFHGKIESPRRINDRLVFLAETERKFFDDIAGYLKNDLKCHSLVTGTIVFGPLGLYAQSGMDFIDSHAYWQHPKFPGRPWDSNHWLIQQRPLSAHPDQSTLYQLGAERLAGKPYTVSEYNHPAPLDSQAECVPMIASFAALQDWDGIWFFTYSHSNDNWGRQNLNSFFDIDTNPAKWGFMISGATLFQRAALPPLPGISIHGLGDSGGDLISEIANKYQKFGSILANSAKITPEIQTKSRVFVSYDTKNHQKQNEAIPAPQITYGNNEQGGLYAVNSLNNIVLCGSTARFTQASQGRVTLQTPAQATLTLVTLDEKPIETSQKILISACGRCENQGMQFSPDRSTLGTQWGQAPAQIEPVTGTVTLPADQWTCQPLKPDGTPAGSFTFDGKLELAPRHATLWYLLTR